MCFLSTLLRFIKTIPFPCNKINTVPEKHLNQEVCFYRFSDKEKVNVSSQIDGPVSGCPNTVNPYHTCVEYCTKKYGENAPPQPPKVSYVISY